MKKVRNIRNLLDAYLQDYFAMYGDSLPPSGLYGPLIKVTEETLIRHCLRRTRGNQIQAARLLGLHRNTLRQKIKALGIDPGCGEEQKDHANHD